MEVANIMAFMDELGSMMGKMAAQAQKIQTYKEQYELMDDSVLIQEYKYLRQSKRNGETIDRFRAICSVLEDRGYHRKNN
jgi:hypothetical protein